MLDGFRSLVPGGKDRNEGPGLYERRDNVRLSCRYQVECKVGADAFNGVVLDLGATGLRLGVARELRRDQEVLLSYKPGGVVVGRQRLKCKVVWCVADPEQGFLCGLLFADSRGNVEASWAMKVLSELGWDARQVVRRKAMRVDSQLPVVINDLDQEREVAGMVVNIGVGGALIRSEKRIESNSRLQLTVGPKDKLPPLNLVARVLSVRTTSENDDIMIGVRFLNHQNTPEIKLLGEYVIKLLREGSTE